MKLSSYSEDLLLSPTTSSGVHIAHIFFIPQPELGTRARCVTNILKSNASRLSYKPSFQAFFFFCSFFFSHGGTLSFSGAFWKKKKGIIFTITVGETVLAKWEVFEGARETLHHERELRVPSKDSSYLNSCLPQRCDSRFYSAWL